MPATLHHDPGEEKSGGALREGLSGRGHGDTRSEGGPPGRENDRYEIVKILGQGGSADVYLARHKALNEMRVLKMLHQGMMLDEKRRHRFFLEAKVSTHLKHPAIVHIYDVTQTDRNLQIEMEFIEGLSLRQELEKRGEFPAPIALALLKAVLEGLDHAHSSRLSFDGVEYDGVIHRDLKPENILLRKDGQPVLCDFGIAKLGADLLTQTRNISGSAAYMAPERLKGEVSTRAIDIFALGVVFYELLKGKRPFQGANKTQVIENILHYRMVDLDAELRGFDPDLLHLVKKATARLPQDRYQNAGEMLQAVSGLYRLYHGDTPPRRVIFDFLTRGQLTTSEFKALLPEKSSMPRAFLLALAAFALAAGLLLALLFAGGGASKIVTPETTATVGTERAALPAGNPPAAGPSQAAGAAGRQGAAEHQRTGAAERQQAGAAEYQEAGAAEHQYRLARAARRQGVSQAEALAAASRALEAADHPTIRLLRAEIYLEMGLHRLALEDLEKVKPFLDRLRSENQAAYREALAKAQAGSRTRFRH